MNQADYLDFLPSRKQKTENDLDLPPIKKIAKLKECEENEGESVKQVKVSKQGISSKKNFGERYLLQHGYKEGSGLGKYENGIIEPVEASKQKGRRGLGFEHLDLKNAVSRYDPSLEEISLDEEVIWLHNNYDYTVKKECLESWVHIGDSKRFIDSNSHFCNPEIISNILSSKNILNPLTSRELDSARRRSNPFESIHNAIFLNRAAMKMANLDAILGQMFTEPKDPFDKKLVAPNSLLYFADVCAGPGGFSEYVFYRKKCEAKGFGFTLRNENDFLLDQFWAGPSESFEPHYGVENDGNVYLPENILSFKNHVLKYTKGEGVHFMMADGGVHINEKLNDQELICKKLYLCQCLIALHIVRTGGHFVVKLFDLFTDFSVGLIYLMYRSFRSILIIKPNTSRPANSERYLVCKWKREDCKDIADHLFEINKKVPVFNETQDTPKKDVLELVPSNVLIEDKIFYDYIKSSNERFGKKQIISLLKLAAFSENQDLIEERQQELRKECLKKWNIPDEVRAEPKKCDARTKWTELLQNTSLCDLETDTKSKKILSYEYFKKHIFAKCSWYCQVLSGEESNNTCTFYLGLGRNNVYKFVSGRWMKLVPNNLCLPANTIVYGELVHEYLGTGRSQRKIYGFHIIDGLILGSKNIRHFPFTKRLKMCRLFAEALYKETCPVRVKDTFMLANIHLLWEKLEFKSIKSYSLQSLCIPLDADSFSKAVGLLFIRDTKGDWNRYCSNEHNLMYFHNSDKKERSFFECDVYKMNLSEKVYADFECSFRTRLVWWWDDNVVVHENQTFQPDPAKLQKSDIMDFISQHK